jgi:hypothetical protein
MANPVIQFKRGVLANLPGLQAGEPGFTTDSYDLYVGINSTTGENKIVGSHRFWTNNTSSTGSGVNLVEGTSNGTSYITLKSPDSLAGITTYTFPATATDGYFLKTNSSGVLSWDQVVSNINIAADSGTPDSVSTGATITFSGGEGIDTTVTDNTITIAAELASDTNKGVASFDATDFTVSTGVVTVNAERVQDIVGAMVSSNTETLITVTYQDSDGTIDFVVDNDLANYSNTTSGFITASSTTTLTNKTFDANGTGNSLSNVEVADFAASAIVTEGEGISSSDNDTSIPTSAAVKDYTDTAISGIDLTLGINADSGGPSTVATSQTLTVSGTAGEIETSVSSQTITVGLPNTVVVGTAVSTPTLQVATIKHSNGTNAATIDTSGNLTAAQNLTVSGNLYVNGSTTQVNTASMTVEDRTIELGQVDGSAPASATTWDLGVLFNYNSSGAKKSAVIWEHADGRFKFGSQVSDGGGTDNDSPQITVSNYAAIEIGALWVNDCAGQSQVISCTGTIRYLENITIDGGSF